MGKAKREFDWRAVRTIALASYVAMVCLAAGSLAQARAPYTSDDAGSNFGLLSVEDGRAIADVAREQGQTGHGVQDCSHVVHETYLRAGFDYPYASSFELYAGHESFGRVRNAQAGDLVVWPGHVGIVLDPREHSFYSLVSTGLEAQDYQGPYWKSRGRPRFYRYRVANGGAIAAAKARVFTPSLHSVKQGDTGVVAEERSAELGSDSNRPPKMAAERTKVVNAPTAQPADKGARTTFDPPQSIVIAAGSKQPTTSQVSEGIYELSNASGRVLRTDDPSKLVLPLVIFERLRVERVEIKRDHGWARLQIDSRATVAGGETNFKRRREKVRWELRHTELGWEAIPPADRIYVPNDVAVRNLAAQLAWLTEGDGAEAHQEAVLPQEARLANLLSALLENK
jgi:hypothetical protein